MRSILWAMLTAAEYHMQEPVPLHIVHRTILDFCRGRADIVDFGAQAVNIHVREPRMTQDVDLLAPEPGALARELAAHLRTALHIAARVGEVRVGVGYRVYQKQKTGTRHLADVRIAPSGLGDVDEGY